MFDSFDTEDWGCGAWLLCIVLVLVIAIVVLCFEAWLVMFLWNAVIPLIWTTAPTLGFWAAMGLLLLCHLLFGSTVRSGGSGKK